MELNEFAFPLRLPTMEDVFFHGANSTSWWDDINDDVIWQDRIYDALSTSYAFVGIIALVQLIRIQRRVPEYGWTTQKVFHLLNFFVNSVRSVVFFFRREVQALIPHALSSVVLDLPGVLFFSTYTLLVLFWAEIYHQARGLPTDGLRPTFLFSNAAIYAMQFSLWGYMWIYPSHHHSVETVSKYFFAGVSFAAALGFLLYGGRLFLMLRRFPIESRGRRKKLNEVGFVTGICFICFSVRAALMLVAGFYKPADLDVLNHPVLNFTYYFVVELVPSSLVLYILRKLPPKRSSTSEPII